MIMRHFKIILYCPQIGSALLKKETISPSQALQPPAFFFMIKSPAEMLGVMCEKTYDPKTLTDIPVQKLAQN